MSRHLDEEYEQSLLQDAAMEGTPMTYTPEPWTIEKVVSKPHHAECQQWVEGPVGYGHIALLADGQGRSFNAERIVACVNGCAGLTEDQIKEAIKAWKQKHLHD